MALKLMWRKKKKTPRKIPKSLKSLIQWVWAKIQESKFFTSIPSNSKAWNLQTTIWKAALNGSRDL